MPICRGVATKFRLEGGRIATGGTVSGESKPPTPKFRFLLGFRPLYFEILENLKILANIQKIFFKSRDFRGGDIPPEF